jgi:phosphatidylglycerol lysyltransferase
MELLLLKYGYLILFLGVVVEGEAFLIAGSFLASRGYFNLATVMLVALAANALSAQFYYTAARVRGRRWFESRFPENSPYRKIINWVGRRTNFLLLISRFLFGFRIVIPAACGAFGMPVARFIILNIVAGLLWAIPTALAGYYFGSSVSVFFRDARQYTLAVFLIIGVSAVAIYLSWRHIQRFRSIFQNLEWSDLHNTVPFIMGLMGTVNIVSAIWPSSERLVGQLQEWLPLEVSQGSRILMLFTGFALLQVSRNLARRKELAWYVAVIALSVSLLLHFTSGFDAQNSLVAAMLLTYLLYFRRRFYTRTDPASLRKGLMATPLLLLIVFSYGVTGFAATHQQFEWDDHANPLTEAVRTGILIVQPDVVPMTRYAALFLISIQVAGWMARIYILILLLRPVILRNRIEAPKEDIDRIFQHYGTQSAAAFAIQPDKHHLLVANHQGLVAYATKGSIALACGDPIAPDELFDQAVKDYLDHCGRHGWMPCVYLAAEERLPLYQSLRLQWVKVAEEAIIDLARLPAMDSIPHAYAVHRYDRSEYADALIDEQLEEVTEDWLETRHMREMSFTVGHFSLEQLSQSPVFIFGDRHYVEAFCAWLPYKGGKAAVLDLVRQRRNAPSETVLQLVAHALRMLRDAGFEEASLTDSTIDRTEIEKFYPRWESRYLVHPRGVNLSKITKALTAIQKR